MLYFHLEYTTILIKTKCRLSTRIISIFYYIQCINSHRHTHANAHTTNRTLAYYDEFTRVLLKTNFFRRAHTLRHTYWRTGGCFREYIEHAGYIGRELSNYEGRAAEKIQEFNPRVATAAVVPQQDRYRKATHTIMELQTTRVRRRPDLN